MSRRHLALCIGSSLGYWIGQGVRGWALPAADGWMALAAAAPRSARYVQEAILLPFPIVSAVLSFAVVTFLEVHGVLKTARPRRQRLPPLPFDPNKTQLIIGEEH